MGLLVARHQRLGEQAADAFAATEAQITGPRGQALAGNHSDTTFSPPGEKAPSAKPNNPREKASICQLVAKTCAMQITD